MPRLEGVKEEIHQPRYDTLVRTNAVTTLEAQSTLFGAPNVGRIELTNMKAAGQLPSNQSYSILAMRVYESFGDATLYPLVDRQLFFQLNIGEKTQLQGHAWYLPAGGGTFGFDPTGATPTITNGVPSHESILRIAKPITLPPQQDFQVDMLFKAVGTEVALTTLNADTAAKVITVLVDGILMRDAL